jgi:transposase
MRSVLAAPPLRVAEDQHVELERIARSSSMPHRSVIQAKALLMSADGVAIYEVARRLKVASNSVRSWRRRFETDGVDGVGRIAKGRGRRSWLPEGTVAELVRVTLEEVPDDGSTLWSTRTLGQRMGVGKDTVARIWKDHNIKPWRTETFKISTDPDFEASSSTSSGSILTRPNGPSSSASTRRPVVQALDRTQQSLPMTPGRAGTMTHDYKRNGTTDLFAAMNVGTGEVLYDTRTSHKGTDVLAFFKLIDLHVPRELDVHVVLDSLSAHKAEPIRTWLKHPKRARWHLHFTLTSSSWLNWSRGLVLDPHQATAQEGDLLLGRPASRGHRDLGRALERRPDPLRLEEAGRRDHCQGHTGQGDLGFSEISDGPLGSTDNHDDVFSQCVASGQSGGRPGSRRGHHLRCRGHRRRVHRVERGHRPG